MSNQFTYTGNTVTVRPANAGHTSNVLNANTYRINQDQFGNYFLEQVENFTLPEKIYGDFDKITDRVINTYYDRKNSTGVLLSGTKGTGKTLLMKKICVEARNNGMPVILINTPYHGESFNAFIQMIDCPCVILFDEFEKVYSNNDYCDSLQNSLLTILDGVYVQKKLFLFTANEHHKISRFMIDRPGRIFYHLKFDSITEDFVREYCQDNLNDKTKIESIVNYISLGNIKTFDILAAIVEEMNRYNEDVSEATKMLNIGDDDAAEIEFDVLSVSVNGKKLTNIEHFACFGSRSDFSLRLRQEIDEEPESLTDDYTVEPVLKENSIRNKGMVLPRIENSMRKILDEKKLGVKSINRVQFNYNHIVNIDKDMITLSNGTIDCLIKKKQIAYTYFPGAF